MKQIIKYVAADGTEFADEVECLTYEATTVQRMYDLSDMVGRTVLSVKATTCANGLEAIVIQFTDMREIILIGGGYSGRGDYIRVAERHENI